MVKKKNIQAQGRKAADHLDVLPFHETLPIYLVPVLKSRIYEYPTGIGMGQFDGMSFP
ncbi:MAG: hypothetical protein R2875_17515 [Desulfobacterales bacterium]